MPRRLRLYAVLPFHAFLAFGLALSPPVHSESDADHTTQPAMESGPDEIVDTQTAVVDVTALGDMAGLIDKLADKRVVFVGESHDRYEDHLNQWAIIYGLHVKEKDLAIGMEFFQQPFQDALDDYVAGRITEADLLRRTGYFERWRFDYRLYRPILRLARDHGIPIVALNLEKEITEKVGDDGIEALNEAQRARIPADMDRDDPAYRARVRAVFDAHPQMRDHGKEEGEGQPEADDARFERFLSVQLLWDEGMAERAARYLQENPGKMMVILSGAGHVEYGQGIPKRLQRRIDAPAAIVLNGTQRDLDPQAADFLLYPRRVSLPAAGLLGVLLDTDIEGRGCGRQGVFRGEWCQDGRDGGGGPHRAGRRDGGGRLHRCPHRFAGWSSWPANAGGGPARAPVRGPRTGQHGGRAPLSGPAQPPPDRGSGPELLAPAGTLKSLRFALAYGADAVYAGLPRYSLRVRNNDFDAAALAEGISAVHACGRRLYLACNLMPHGAKLRTFIDDLEPIVALGPDALIMADPGLILMVRERWPGLGDPPLGAGQYRQRSGGALLAGTGDCPGHTVA